MSAYMYAYVSRDACAPISLCGFAFNNPNPGSAPLKCLWIFEMLGPVLEYPHFIPYQPTSLLLFVLRHGLNHLLLPLGIFCLILPLFPSVQWILTYSMATSNLDPLNGSGGSPY